MSQPDYVIVIPARYDSVRLPGKVLQDIAGKPMIRHVWEAASRSGASTVVVATDDERIQAVVSGFGGQAVMTAADHASGSDRIAECAERMGWRDQQLIVNLQGDEPEMPPECLDQVAKLLAQDESADVATLYRAVESAGEVEDPNCVKVVVSAQGQALYFSRAPVPHARDYSSFDAALEGGVQWFRHLGLYCYRLSALRCFTATPPTVLERSEHLEQLRFLESGVRILAASALAPIPPGIDTPEDLENARERMS